MMSGSRAVPSGALSAQQGQTLFVSLASIAVVAVAALLLRSLDVPDEVTASLSTASGAVVPAVAIRRRERAKGKSQRIEELVSGTFERPRVYVLIIAGCFLAVAEFLTYFFVGFLGGVVALAAEESGFLSTEESAAVLVDDAVIVLVALLGLLVTAVIAVPVGIYVAHRIKRHPLYWAFGALLLAQAVSLLIELVWLRSPDTPPNFLAYAIFVAVIAVPLWFGVHRGVRTRALFRAKRLFHRLPESDRATVLALMEEVQVSSRLGDGAVPAEAQ